MHLHLDPVGGIAGDMFAGAILDLRPDWEEALRGALDAAGFARFIQIVSHAHDDNVLTGRRFDVRLCATEPPAGHRTFREIRQLLQSFPLAPGVSERALSMFTMLAQAESRVHGVPMDDVSFHELGAWDSIVDILAAAWLIEQLGEIGWSCGPLPMGCGQVMSQHGRLPVPAPATALLLEGFPLFQDGLEGERITPTGAVILRHLRPSFAPLRPMRLIGSGIGFGARALKGISNVLRVLAFENLAPATVGEQVVVCQFELDDQTSEDLAVAIDHLRASPGVLDLMQLPVFGKKGRLAVQLQVLASLQHLDEVLAQCFTETSTLGVRWQIVQRTRLNRDTRACEVAGRTVRVKRANRPGHVVTSKADMDDLAGERGGLAGRERLRRQAQDMALDAAPAFAKDDNVEPS